MKMKDIKNISGIIRVESGLHIGAGKDSIEIGGLDNPVIKNPLTREPYIPGSSIKGKMRSLLETRFFCDNLPTRKYVVEKGAPCGCGQPDCPVCVIFGCSEAKNRTEELGPTRIIVRDAVLSVEFQNKHRAGELPMEVKYENSIHRVKGIAENPRPLERVPAGVEFDFSITLKLLEQDSDDLLNWVFKGLRLIELDALGGCSSRGSGRVTFRNLICNSQPVDLSAISIA